MADVKISGLTAKGATLAATDELEINEAGTSKKVTGAQIAALTPAASATLAGIVELATNAELATGTSTVLAVTPANITALTSSITQAGIVELATDAEGVTGTDTARAMTAAAMRASLVDGNDTLLGKFNLKDYGEIVNAIGSTGGGTQDIDLTLGNVVSATVDTSTNTFTFSNPTATGKNCGFILYLTNGGSQTVAWPASVDFPAATAPTLTASGVDILVFNTTDAGTRWYGNLVGAAYA